MDVFEAIRTVLAVRQYWDTPVPEDVIRRILEAGRLTGSAKNLWPGAPCAASRRARRAPPPPSSARIPRGPAEITRGVTAA
jgi:nitroreductase